MRIRNQKDFWAGVMFAVLGLLFVVLSQQYQLGTAAKMGPGYFPTMLGGLMAILGFVTAWLSTSRSNVEAKLSKVGWREIFLILFSVAVFATALQPLGMIIAVILLIGIAATASHEFNWKETIISIIVLLIASELVFVKGLELQFPVWPKFMTN
ncbi:MAG: tripartite tricarboxylate transporter TctB family protein [Burkholderiaceae bacterium]